MGILEIINVSSPQWEQKKEMNLLFQWYPWHRYWVASLNILQHPESLLSHLQQAQSFSLLQHKHRGQGLELFYFSFMPE